MDDSWGLVLRAVVWTSEILRALRTIRQISVPLAPGQEGARPEIIEA